MPLSSHFSFPHSYFRVTRLCLGFCFLHLHAHWGPYLGALMEQTCCIHPYIRALLLNTFQKYMFLASYPCKLFPMHVIGWSLCMRPVLIVVLTLPSGVRLWCTDGYQMYSGNIFHGGNESGCQLFTLQQRVVSLILKWVPTFSVALYVLSWRALLASNNHEV